MGSVNSPNSWSPFETYRDCSQGTCSVYCPQWCYIIFPPPPPSGLADDDHDDPSIFQFSPLIVAVIGILASAFILVCYYTIISKYCRRRGSGDTSMELNDSRDLGNNESLQASAAGLDESIVKAITVYRYKKVEGLVEGTDCSVCLSEFQENESLRLLPKCNHAFHLPCIDIWLKSHSTCPLCRSNISSINPLPPQIPDPHPPQETQPANRISALQHLYGNHDTILAIQDIVEGDAQDEAVVSLVSDVIPKTTSTQALGDRNSSGARDINTLEIRQDGTFQPFRRSHSMNYSSGQGQVSAAHDILRTREDDVESSRSGVDHEENRCNTINNSSGDSGFDKSPSPRMKRSISTERFMIARYSKGNNSVFPN